MKRVVGIIWTAEAVLMLDVAGILNLIIVMKRVVGHIIMIPPVMPAEVVVGAKKKIGDGVKRFNVGVFMAMNLVVQIQAIL